MHYLQFQTATKGVHNNNDLKKQTTKGLKSGMMITNYLMVENRAGKQNKSDLTNRKVEQAKVKTENNLITGTSHLNYLKQVVQACTYKLDLQVVGQRCSG